MLILVPGLEMTMNLKLMYLFEGVTYRSSAVELMQWICNSEGGNGQSAED
jgi:hypothetical protein